MTELCRGMEPDPRLRPDVVVWARLEQVDDAAPPRSDYGKLLETPNFAVWKRER